jgi:uncharacterized protein (TIGR00251 family)
MIIEVKVVPGARKNSFEESDGIYKIYLTAPPVEGKANKALIDFLSEHFGRRKSEIEIIKGLKSRMKTIKIGAKISEDTYVRRKT